MSNGERRSLRGLLVVLFACLALPAAALALGTTYKGKTSQGKRVTIKIVNGKLVMKHSLIYWRAKCTHDGKAVAPIFGWTDFTGKVKGSSFAIKGSYVTLPGGPAKEVNTASMAFTLTGTQLTGTFSLKTRVYYVGTTPPTLTDRCHTGKLTFTANG